MAAAKAARRAVVAFRKSTFQNGDRYVGQSTNVVGRFAAHRRRWDDIEFLDYLAVHAADLDAVEQDEIRVQERPNARTG